MSNSSFRARRGQLLVVLLLAACGRQAPAVTVPAVSAAAPAAVAPTKPLSTMAQVGRRLFFEPALSISGQQSCASCHDPAHAFAPPNGLAVQLGGPNLDRPGLRAVPKLTYLILTPPFSIGPDDEGTLEAHPAPLHGGKAVLATAPTSPALARVAPGVAKSGDPAAAAAALVPRGGLFWDGRVDTLQGQALAPLLNPLEMGNTSAAEVVAKLRRLGVAAQLEPLAGAGVDTDDKLLLSEALFAIGRYEAEEKAFASYDSKYDRYLDGKLALSEAEQRGLKLYEDPKKGNCAACHPDRKGAGGTRPLFTDFQFEALGVPRNAEIAANTDPKFHDLGLCGPERKDAYSRQASNCGLFKTPSLRNVATRGAFFHNGVYHSLEQVLRFYAGRDLHPEKFYPRKADGTVDAYDDLPPRYRANLDTLDAPFDRKPGQAPALDEAEQADIIAFLKTLTDGYRDDTAAAR